MNNEKYVSQPPLSRRRREKERKKKRARERKKEKKKKLLVYGVTQSRGPLAYFSGRRKDTNHRMLLLALELKYRDAGVRGRVGR